MAFWRCSALLLPLVALLGSALPLPAAVLAARSRPDAAVELCVLVPRVEELEEGVAFGELLTATPSLLVVEPLQQLRIETEQGALLWSGRATPAQPLTMPLAWPLPPLQSDQEVLLRLQPEGAAGDAFAHVRLRTASTARLQATAALIRSLGANPQAWMVAISNALASGQVALAWTLLYAPQAPAAEALTALRRQLWDRGCGG